MLALVLGSTCFTACRPPTQVYPGPPRKATEVTRLRAIRGRIVEVDRVEQFASSIEVLPGRHEFVARFTLQGEEIAPNVRDGDVVRILCRCAATFEAGARYRIVLDPARPTHQGPIVTRYVHRPALIDDRDDRRLFLSSDCEGG